MSHTHGGEQCLALTCAIAHMVCVVLNVKMISSASRLHALLQVPIKIPKHCSLVASHAQVQLVCDSCALLLHSEMGSTALSPLFGYHFHSTSSLAVRLEIHRHDLLK